MWVQTPVTITAGGAFQPLVAANPKRLSLRLMNIGTNPVTVVPLGTASPVVGVGMNYTGAGSAGDQGGADDFPLDGGKEGFLAASSAGTTVVIWEYMDREGVKPVQDPSI